MTVNTLLRHSRYVDLIGAAVCLLLTVGLYLAGIVPLLAAHDEYADDQQACAREQEHARRLEASLETLRAELDQARREARENTVHLRPPATAPLHVAHISRLATEAGLQVDDMRTGDPTPGPFATTVPVHLSGSGTYTACTLFLQRLRQALPETCVMTFALNGQPNDTTGAAALTMDLAWHATLPGSRAGGTETSPARHGADPSETPET